MLGKLPPLSAPIDTKEQCSSTLLSGSYELLCCFVVIVAPILDKIKPTSNFFFLLQGFVNICVCHQKMPGFKMGSGNYAVKHLLFKVKEQNILVSIFVLFHSGSEKGQKAFIFCFLMPSYIPRNVQHNSFPFAS